MAGDDSRAVLLAEIDVWRRQIPFLSLYLIAQAIHAARLPASAEIADLDDESLRMLLDDLRRGAAS